MHHQGDLGLPDRRDGTVRSWRMLNLHLRAMRGRDTDGMLKLRPSGYRPFGSGPLRPMRPTQENATCHGSISRGGEPCLHTPAVV
jgi:hypothetical protein